MRVVLLLLVLAGCGDNERYRFDHLVQLTGGSPYGGDCNGAPQTGTVHRGMEVEPSLAIAPQDPSYLLAAWQQDRWSNGGANGIVTAVSHDAGAHWQTGLPRFSHCAGGDYERASDPWVAIGPTGTAYAIAISFDQTTDRSSVLAARSSAQSADWEDPATLIADDDPDVFNDKESITADPYVDGRVYAVWDRLTGLTQPNKPVGTGPTMFARFDGNAWEAARAIYDPGVDAQTIGNQITVLPDGTLVDVFLVITMSSTMNPMVGVGVIRSTDRGDTWSAPIMVSPVQDVGFGKGGIGVRTGGLPEIAADPVTGALYITWEDSSFDQMHAGVAVAHSLDGGLSWSPPVQANGAPDVHACTPSLAVNAGTVGVLYYDTREDDAASPAFGVTAWLATSDDRGLTWSDERMSSAFDLRPALAGGSYFLGDYQGLAGNGETFVPLFGIAFVDNDRTDIFVRP